MLLEKETKVQELERAMKTTEFKYKLEIKNLSFSEQKLSGLLNESREKLSSAGEELARAQQDLEKAQQKISKLKEEKQGL